MELPILFGVRPLSPAGAWHLLQLLEEKRPRLVLIEGPSDLTPLLADLVRPDTVPPVPRFFIMFWRYSFQATPSLSSSLITAPWRAAAKSRSVIAPPPKLPARAMEVPPVAMLAYTQAAPVRSILYPLAAYSPEYQAMTALFRPSRW